MPLQDKLRSIFHTLSRRKRSANADPEDQNQSQHQNQSQNETLRPKEQDQGVESNGHYDDTYGALSEVAAPEPVEPEPSHRPSLEGRFSESRRLSHRWLLVCPKNSQNSIIRNYQYVGNLMASFPSKLGKWFGIPEQLCVPLNCSTLSTKIALISWFWYAL